MPNNERIINNSNFSLGSEIKNLELLKLKFGETFVQNCDIIIKDIKDNIKFNSDVVKDKMLNCLIINKNYWPFTGNSLFDISNLDPSNNSPSQEDNLNASTNKFDSRNKLPLIPYDKFLTEMKSHIDNYVKIFKEKRVCRNLNFYTNVGYVELNLSFKNGTFKFMVSLLSGYIIKLFSKENEQYFSSFTIPYIAEKLKADEDDVKKKINFWVTKGVLKEVLDESGKVKYYTPEENYKQMNDGRIICEEEISYLSSFPIQFTH